ncbi:unnamed protein product [Eruca vesicaria subsp. sativa]|uniref:Uncharacterized protein n=1 Tax=Eruca vesicaria subsp. sativa TaxID=29727 RepID=A0ABC8LRC4_ERUVS|nr:unnamed protein product [Eruca vesicaria subsp. sativa]
MMVVQLWETLKETITAYTGFCLAALFTVLALAIAGYHVVPRNTTRVLRNQSLFRRRFISEKSWRRNLSSMTALIPKSRFSWRSKA